MAQLLRVDDFRCHDPCTVEVLRGREAEAVAFAVDLQRQRYPVTLFVRENVFEDWSFLEGAGEIERFDFSGFSSALTGERLASIHHARHLSLRGARLKLDFSVFRQLQGLVYDWHRGSGGLDQIDGLQSARLFGLGAAGNARPLPVPPCLEALQLFDFRHQALEFPRPMERLSVLEIERARPLRRLPPLPGLRDLELKQVGRERFDYATLPPGLERLVLDGCAPLDTWDAILRLEHLRHLVIWRMSIPPVGPEVRRFLDGVELDVYRNRSP